MPRMIALDLYRKLRQRYYCWHPDSLKLLKERMEVLVYEISLGRRFAALEYLFCVKFCTDFLMERCDTASVPRFLARVVDDLEDMHGMLATLVTHPHVHQELAALIRKIEGRVAPLVALSR